MEEKFDLTKQHVDIPDFYTYTEEWCDTNIREVHDLDSICKTKDAEYELCRFLEEIGAEMYMTIKKFNRKVKSLSRDKLTKMLKKDGTSIFYLNEDFKASFSLYYDNLTFENDDLVEDLEGYLSDYHAELAPVVFRKAAKDVKDLAKKAIKPIGKTINYLDDFEKEFDRLENQEVDDYILEISDENEEAVEEDEQVVEEVKRSARDYSYFNPEPNVIERTHVKVQEGFVYILSNDLMPNIFKVGFTSRNPDQRCAEISAKSGLPVPFKVEKYWRSDDPYIVEQRIHTSLSDSSQGREYFRGDLKKICAVIEDLIKTNNQTP